MTDQASPADPNATFVGPFGAVASGAVLGPGCRVESHASVASGAVLGARVRVGAGTHVPSGVQADDDVVIESGVSFGTHAPDETGGAPTKLGRGAWIGAGATLAAGVSVGARARVVEGAVIDRSVPPNAIVRGHPATIVGYVNGIRRTPDFVQGNTTGRSGAYARIETSVRGVTLHRFPSFDDLRGSLSVGLFEKQMPFAPRRFFFVYDVPGAEARGEHAHRACHQFLICTHGSCAVVVDDGTRSEELALDHCSLGLYMPPLTWGVQYKYSHDAVVLVFASHEYDPADYIRDYQTFLTEAQAAR